MKNVGELKTDKALNMITSAVEYLRVTTDSLLERVSRLESELTTYRQGLSVYFEASRWVEHPQQPEVVHITWEGSDKLSDMIKPTDKKGKKV